MVALTGLTDPSSTWSNSASLCTNCSLTASATRRAVEGSWSITATCSRTVLAGAWTVICWANC